MARPTIPASVKEFVAAQPTRPVAELDGGEAPGAGEFPWSEFVYRLVAGFLLSGDIRPKQDGYPNRTDLERVGKRSNFNPELAEFLGRLFIAGDVIAVKSGRYVAGANIAALDGWDLVAMRGAFMKALVRFIDEATPLKYWRPSPSWSSGFPDFLAAFVRAFRGLAIDWRKAGEVVSGFSVLPSAALASLTGGGDEWRFPGRYWFDEPGRKIFFDALMSCRGGALLQEEVHGKGVWFVCSGDAEIFCGLAKAPKPGKFARELKVQSDLTVVAGSDLPVETLGTLLRGATLKGKGKVLTMKLDKQRIDALRPDRANFARFRAVLESGGTLPPNAAALLGGGAPLAGAIRLRMCRALVRFDNQPLLEAVKKHPRLKGYVDPAGPPGYLLVKPSSSLANFLTRCRECGFEISVEP